MVYTFCILYVFNTSGYTIVQFFCYTGATHKKTATQWLHSYTRKSGWFMHLTCCNPKKSGQIAGLLLIHMSLCQINYTCKNCGFPEKFDKMLIIYKSIKMAIFTKNIPKHTDQSVCHKKHTIKTAENWHHSPYVC